MKTVRFKQDGTHAAVLHAVDCVLPLNYSHTQHLNEKLAAVFQSKFKCVQHKTPRPLHAFRESRINLQ
jgi:hypothetical protein